MRVLILWAELNGERQTVATALAEQFSKMNIECEIAEVCSFFGGRDAHTKLSKCYAKACASKSGRFAKDLEELCGRGAEELQIKLQAEGFDTVVCTHVVAALTQAQVKLKFNNAAPYYSVSTDYTWLPALSEVHADGYFVGHGWLYGAFIRCNIQADRLHASGIPLPASFYQSSDRAKARRVLGLSEDGSVVLVNCMGSLHRRAYKNIRALTSRLPKEITTVVLCGENETFMEQLRQIQTERLVAVGNVQSIEPYLSAADVYITPPVGIWVAEAMAKRVPTLLKGSLRGYETRNAAFLVDHGVTQLTKAPEQAVERVLALLKNPKNSEALQEAMDSIMPPIAAEHICRYILKREI